MNIYVASSWRNKKQPSVVEALRKEKHTVYDFRHPDIGDDGFHWDAIDPNWMKWDLQKYMIALQHPEAEAGFTKDYNAMLAADACVLVLPCGKSAHLEAGWFAAHKVLYILLDEEGFEPELMYAMAYMITTDINKIIESMNKVKRLMAKWKQQQQSS